MTLKSEYLLSALVTTMIFIALMVTNALQFYQAYNDPNKRSVTVLYTPINISSSVVFSIVTILLVLLIYGLISLQAHFGARDSELKSS